MLNMMLQRGLDIGERNYCGDRALEIAAFSGHLSMVSLLLDLGLDADYHGCHINSLIAAVMKDNKDMVTLLLDRGADVNFVGNKGTALYEATTREQLAMMQLLLDRGADLDIDETGGQSLGWAVRNGKEAFVRFFAKQGVDLELYCWDSSIHASYPIPILDALHSGQHHIVNVINELLAKPLDLDSYALEKKLRDDGYPKYASTDSFKSSWVLQS